jgi:predicted nucleic acid-binding protein
VIILDTNVVSETMKQAPARRPMEWLGAQPAMDVYLTTITEAELLTGIALMPAGRRRNLIKSAWDALVERLYGERILPFDRGAAKELAHIVTSRRRLGPPIALADAQIAAMARSPGALLATRNVADFTGCGIAVVDPWG